MQKHQVLEADVKAHDNRIQDLNKRADEFIEIGTWDSVAIRDRKKMINERYEMCAILRPIPFSRCFSRSFLVGVGIVPGENVAGGK